jgi:predicted pyridoxine 5'-phosphate oxidase superfamily flavin-nucleotide-binding protein
VLDKRTIGFIDFSGNRQFISSGNLTENPKAQLFLIDYAQRRRIKIWGEASIAEASAERVKQMMPPDYKAQAEQVILFSVSAWDVNCPQHIPQRFEAGDVSLALAERDQRIRQLEREIGLLRAAR